MIAPQCKTYNGEKNGFSNFDIMKDYSEVYWPHSFVVNQKQLVCNANKSQTFYFSKRLV